MICAQTLAWIELQLGRPACVMEWMHVADAIASSAKLDDKAKQKFRGVRFTQDAVLGMLLLRARQEDLRYLQYLPDVLEELSLEMSRMGLLYALGYEEELRAEGSIPETESAEDIRSFFIKWHDQPAAEDLSEQIVGTAGKMTFVSRILGCNLKFQVEDDNESIFLAERLLAAIEALLSTSLDKEAFPFREEYIVRVERSNRIEGPPKLEIDIDRGFSFVRHSGDIVIKPNADDYWFFEIVAQLVSQIVTTGDIKNYFQRVMGEELGLWRAINFTDTSIPISNILGRQPKLRISDWNTDGKPSAYIVRRIVPWHDGLPSTGDHNESVEMPTFGIGDPPEELLDRSSLKHTARQVVSIINIPLWDKAKWGAAFYAVAKYDLDEPPDLGLGFNDGAAGRAIFKELREKLGTDDKDNRLRISIITGIDKDDPTAYAIVVGSNLPTREKEKGPREFVSVSRVHKMHNTDPLNLKRFEDQVSRTKLYRIFPVQLPSGDRQGEFFDELAILKNAIRITPAWQIGENDLDSPAIGPDDKPVIPPDVVDAPVFRLLDRRKRLWSKSL